MQESCQFKIGDRVRVIYSPHFATPNELLGLIGRVIETPKSNIYYPYVLEFPNRRNGYFYSLELIPAVLFDETSYETV